VRGFEHFVVSGPNLAETALASLSSKITLAGLAKCKSRRFWECLERPSKVYTVQYVASGRDLLRELQPSTTKKVVLFANPAFDLASTAMLAKAEDRSADAGSKSIRGSEERDVEDFSFGSLEGV
jgi:hypothetical protein